MYNHLKCSKIYFKRCYNSLRKYRINNSMDYIKLMFRLLLNYLFLYIEQIYVFKVNLHFNLQSDLYNLSILFCIAKQFKILLGTNLEPVYYFSITIKVKNIYNVVKIIFRFPLKLYLIDHFKNFYKIVSANNNPTLHHIILYVVVIIQKVNGYFPFFYRF